MKIQKIKNRSVLFTTSPSSEWDLNVHLIMGDKNNYIIDTGLGPQGVKPVLDYIKGNEKPIIIINTHYHWDHIWGNNLFENETIISHKFCLEMIRDNWDEMINENKKYMQGEVSMHLPNLVFEKEMYFEEDNIRIIYTPGHSIDSISVLDEKDKILNAGDNIGDTMDQIVPHIYCGKSLYMDTLNKYSQMNFDTCISGHNIVLGKDIIEKIKNCI